MRVGFTTIIAVLGPLFSIACGTTIAYVLWALSHFVFNCVGNTVTVLWALRVGFVIRDANVDAYFGRV